MLLKVLAESSIEIEIYDQDGSLCEVHRGQSVDDFVYESHELIGEFDYVGQPGTFMKFRREAGSDSEFYECLLVDSSRVVIH